MLKIIQHDKVKTSKRYVLWKKIQNKENLNENEIEYLYKLNDAKLSYYYAKLYKNANIEKCQEACLKSPCYAYSFAFIKGANIERCQETACKDPYWAYAFVLNISGADIEKCQEAACKKPQYAYYFAKYIKGANIEKCKEACLKDLYYVDLIEKCQKAYENSKYTKCKYRKISRSCTHVKNKNRYKKNSTLIVLM